MTEYLLSLDINMRLFFAMAIIVYGYGYIIICIFIKDTLIHTLMLLGITSLSSLCSFMAFKDNNMWVDSPDLTLSVITGSFAATVIFYMFYFVGYYFYRMGGMNRYADGQHLSKWLTVLIFTESSLQLSSDNRSRSLPCCTCGMKSSIQYLHDTGVKPAQADTIIWISLGPSSPARPCDLSAMRMPLCAVEVLPRRV